MALYKWVIYNYNYNYNHQDMVMVVPAIPECSIALLGDVGVVDAVDRGHTTWANIHAENTALNY